MSEINPQFQPVQIRDSITQNLGQNENIISKDGGTRFGKQSSLSKAWTGFKSAFASRENITKRENQKTLHHLSTHLQRQGFSEDKAKSLLSAMKNNAQISSGSRYIQSADIRSLLVSANQIEAMTVSTQTQIINKMQEGIAQGQNQIQSCLMGMVTAHEHFSQVSPNQLHPIANEIVSVLTHEGLGLTDDMKLQRTQNLLQEFNSTPNRHLVEDLKSEIFVSNDANAKPAPKMQSEMLIDLIKFKLECQRAALSGDTQPVFNSQPQVPLSSAERKAHIDTVMAPGSALSQQTEALGVKTQTFVERFTAYCNSIGTGDQSFLRATNPMTPLLDTVLAPFAPFRDVLTAATGGFEKTASRTEFLPIAPGVTVANSQYTPSYEGKLEIAAIDFMNALNSQPAQKEVLLNSIRNIFSPMETAIDNSPLVDKGKRKIEALNAIIQKALPKVIDPNTPEAKEFMTLISRGILLESSIHATTDLSIFNSLRDMLAGHVVSSL